MRINYDYVWYIKVTTEVYYGEYNILRRTRLKTIWAEIYFKDRSVQNKICSKSG